MPTVERAANEISPVPPIQTELPTQTIFTESRTPTSDGLRTRELAKDVEPTAEVIGKMSELSFQKHGGPDNSTMPQRL